MKKILLSPDPGDSGDPAAPTPAPGALHNQPPPPAAPPAAPPPAAAAVLSGTKSERELQLEEENRKLLADKKKVEIHAAELEDENHRLKTPPTPPAPATPAEEEASWKIFDV